MTKGQLASELTFCTLVGMTGFEPAAPRPPGVCATGLRHIPIGWNKLSETVKGGIRVVDTGLEPVTSAMSMQRSKPTELIDPLAFTAPITAVLSRKVAEGKHQNVVVVS